MRKRNNIKIQFAPSFSLVMWDREDSTSHL